MIIAVAIVPLPGGKVTQGQIQRRNPELSHFRLSEIPEQQFAAAYRKLLKIQRGRRLIFIWLCRLFVFSCVGSLPVPREVHAVIFKQIQPDERLLKLNGLKPDNATNQLEKIQVDIQAIKSDNLFVAVVLRRQVQRFHTERKRVAADVTNISLPPHSLLQLIGQSTLQPPGQYQKTGQAV